MWVQRWIVELGEDQWFPSRWISFRQDISKSVSCPRASCGWIDQEYNENSSLRRSQSHCSYESQEIPFFSRQLWDWSIEPVDIPADRVQLHI